jgi:Uncharacterized KleE stable inheritance protein
MKSAKIYQFPRCGRTVSTPIYPSGNALNTSKGSKQAHKTAGWNMITHWPIAIAWLLVGMLWPLLNWMGAMDVLFQCLRALYYSNNPAIHATLQAVIHTACYLLLSAFVYIYRPNVS